MGHNSEQALVDTFELAMTYHELLRSSMSYGGKYTLEQLVEIINIYAGRCEQASGLRMAPAAHHIAATVTVYADLGELIDAQSVDPINISHIDEISLAHLAAEVVDENHLGDLHVGEHGAYIFA